jgi:plasmid stability protein
LISTPINCYRSSVRQLIARIDDALHAQLKSKAAAEGRSLNDLVAEALEVAVGGNDERAQVWARLAAQGRRVVPPRPKRVPTAAAVERLTQGTGTAAGEALAADRGSR